MYCRTVHACLEYIFCTARLYCNGPAKTVTATSLVRSAHGRVLYSTVPRQARAWIEAIMRAWLGKVFFFYCNVYPCSLPIYSILYPLQLSLTPHSPSAGERTVTVERKGHAGLVTELPSDRGSPIAHDGVTFDPHVRWIALFSTGRLS